MVDNAMINIKELNYSYFWDEKQYLVDYVNGVGK